MCPGEPSLERSAGRDLDTQPRVEGTNTYLPTAEGQREAIFYTKVHDRPLRPLLAANAPPAHIELRQTLHTMDYHVRSYIDHVRLGNAAGKLEINLNGWNAKEP